MSALTKVFVVVVTILSVALVAMMVSFVANQEHWKQLFEDAKVRLTVAEKKAQNAEAEISATQERFNQQLTELHNESNALKTQLTTLMGKLDRAEADAAAEAARYRKFEADLARFSAATEQQAAIITAQQQELKDRREEMVKLQTRIIELSDHNNELFSQVETLTRQLRRYQEIVVAMTEENDELKKLVQQAGLEKTKEQVAEWEPAGKRIEGQITRVEQVTGETFVEVNVGSRDGVAPKMRFLVSRGNQFLGWVVIETVDTQSAAGRMHLTQDEIRQGDLIQTGGQF